MKDHYIQIIETLVVLLSYVVTRAIIARLINKTLLKRILLDSRGIAVRKVLNIVVLLICVVVVLLIWGVNQTDLALFVGSILTVVGVAFFAQWSILSNITSSIIIFFNYPVKVNDTIVIMEGKDYQIEGEVLDIGLFFVTLKTAESEEISLPNNIFIQKTIKKMKNKATTVGIKEKS